jgi:hypothetical protein
MLHRQKYGPPVKNSFCRKAFRLKRSFEGTDTVSLPPRLVKEIVTECLLSKVDFDFGRTLLLKVSQMPFVRGRILPEVELAGRTKQFLDILIWAEQLDKNDAASLDELDHLQVYLSSLEPFMCNIRLFLPRRHTETAAYLDHLEIGYVLVDEQEAGDEVASGMRDADKELLIGVQTALSVDADCLVVNRKEWLPFVEEVDKLGFLLTDCSFLLPYAEWFSRGHDIPWSFRYKSWYAPWTAFYTLAETDTFKAGIETLRLAYQKKAPPDAQETGRILVHNRLPNLCFTRDRLLFFEIQRLATKRKKQKRQQFTFEIAYSLNFYYLLIYGAFDHAALFASQILELGLPERQVGATYSTFLNALQKKSAPLFAIFTDPKTKEFIERIGYLRHFAAHRGTLMPSIVVEKPDKEPTDEELDDDIRVAGLDYIIERQPALREMFRTNARMARYEKGQVLEGVVLVELGGKRAFIQPHIDTTWNFSKMMMFLNAIFGECSQLLT